MTLQNKCRSTCLDKNGKKCITMMMIHFLKVVSNYQILSPFLTVKQHNKASYNQAKVDGHTFKFQATADVSQDPEHKY